METKGITCRIPLALHQKITEEMRSQGITVGQFIEQIIHEHYEKDLAFSHLIQYNVQKHSAALQSVYYDNYY